MLFDLLKLTYEKDTRDGAIEPSCNARNPQVMVKRSNRFWDEAHGRFRTLVRSYTFYLSELFEVFDKAPNVLLYKTLTTAPSMAELEPFGLPGYDITKGVRPPRREEERASDPALSTPSENMRGGVGARTTRGNRSRAGRAGGRTPPARGGRSGTTAGSGLTRGSPESSSTPARRGREASSTVTRRGSSVLDRGRPPRRPPATNRFHQNAVRSGSNNRSSQQGEGGMGQHGSAENTASPPPLMSRRNGVAVSSTVERVIGIDNMAEL